MEIIRELFLDEVPKSDAKYVYKGSLTFTGETLGQLEEIQKPKIVDLSGLVENSEILFEFSDDREDWFEDYLSNIDTESDYCFESARKINSNLEGVVNFKQIRFAPRWYFHDGKSGCPLPEGIGFEAQCTRIVNGSTNIYSDNNKRDRQCWIHAPHLVKVIAYRPTGLLPGYVMPGGE